MSHKLNFSSEAKVRAHIAAHWGLERNTIDAWLAAASLRDFARGQSVYPQGTHRGSVFFVLEGVVSMSVLLPHGQRILCGFYQPGALFGFPLVEGQRPRWSAADAFTPARVALVPRRDFERVLTSQPAEVTIRFFNRLLERQARFAMRLVHCVALDLRGRLALTLLDLATTFGVAEAEGVRIDLPISHENLAEMVGASRERISRAMSELMGKRIIHYTRQAVLVPDVARLRDAATPKT